MGTHDSLREKATMPIRSPHLWASCRHVLRRTATEWTSDNATRWSASVAFYTLLSLIVLRMRVQSGPDAGQLFMIVTLLSFLYAAAAGLEVLVYTSGGPR